MYFCIPPKLQIDSSWVVGNTNLTPIGMLFKRIDRDLNLQKRNSKHSICERHLNSRSLFLKFANWIKPFLEKRVSNIGVDSKVDSNHLNYVSCHNYYALSIYNYKSVEIVYYIKVISGGRCSESCL
jgi:hypothetical protein